MEDQAVRVAHRRRLVVQQMQSEDSAELVERVVCRLETVEMVATAVLQLPPEQAQLPTEAQVVRAAKHVRRPERVEQEEPVVSQLRRAPLQLPTEAMAAEAATLREASMAMAATAATLLPQRPRSVDMGVPPELVAPPDRPEVMEPLPRLDNG